MHRVAVLAAALVMTIGSATHAQAWTDDDPPTPIQTPQDSGGSVTAQVADCSVVSSSSYLGLSCAGSVGSTESIRELLDGDPLPDCWHEPLTAAELDAMGLENTGGPDWRRWYWERCLEGIDPETLRVQPGGVRFTIGVLSLGPDDDIVVLTSNQTDLVRFQSRDRQIPAPIAAVSPSAYPRVGAWVAFFNGQPAAEVVASAGSVTLRARVSSMDVRPLGAGSPLRVSCPGMGIKANRGDSPSTLPDACWHKYLNSSADQPEQVYPVVIAANWQVDYRVGGGAYRPFNSFTKSSVTMIPVTEIQTLVVR